MPKRTTIDAIRTLNPTATPDFLEEFSADELTHYLNRLTRVSPQGCSGPTDAHPATDRPPFAPAMGSPELC